ncbi:unnamed protein product [Mytilus coruscus]|uniref:Ig-like domain-containing protein n=1 Tax=Mytilus coruscus TaxID=42192 RepID=A0A6J8E8F3_MYTCO|nr:unnamed protein product [Mytilus coruscus]
MYQLWHTPRATWQNCTNNPVINFSNFRYFPGENLLCDCDFMWFVYFSYAKPFETQGGKCAKNNKTVSELEPRDFDCIDNVLPVKNCNASQSVVLHCEYNYLTTYLIRWIHSRNGKFIRELNKDFVDENTNTLHFSFCNHDDSGEYTCMLSTDYSLLPSINRSVQLLVNGPPVVLNQHTENKGGDLILSVMFFSIPYDFIIQWLQGPDNLNEDPQYTIAINNMTVGLNQYNVNVTTDGFISNLTIHNFKRRPSDVYSCQISNVYGVVVEQFVLGPATLELERRTYCDTSNSIELNCTLQLVGATPVSWIHSNAGETIRSLEGKHINNSNILTFPFCNGQDTGDYTCRWKTDIIGQTIMEKSTTLSKKGGKLPHNFLSEISKLDVNIDPSEIVAAHRIPGKPGIPRPILVKFLRMESKIALLRNRKLINEKLEVRISDDVTRLNQGLLNRLYLHEDVTSAWYFNRHIYGTDNNGERHRFDIYDNIRQKLKSKNKFVMTV